MPEPRPTDDDSPTRSFDPALPDTVAADAVDSTPPIDAVVPGYELLAELGRGGMGVVYKARQVTANRVVALKMIPSGGFATEIQRQRFRAEAEAVAVLDHPGIVPIYEIGDAGSGPYFSMKLINGRTLRDALADPAWQPDLKARIALLAKVARAVHHAHQRGVIHRDIKPANILLDEAGEPHVTDFGLAKRVESGDSLTHTGAVFGTPAYMPPEQAGGGSKNVTTLADVYSLGAVLYEILVGRPPFQGDGAFDIAHKVLTQEPESLSQVRPDVDRDLEAVCQKCLTKQPEGRYGSAADLADDLDRWVKSEPLSVRPPSIAYLLWRRIRDNVRTAVWVALIGVFCTLFGTMPIILAATLTLFMNASKTFDKFPSAEKPWLLRLNWEGIQRVFGQPYVAAPSVILGIALFSYMGLFGVWVARTRSWWDDLSVGLGLGFVSGQTLMLFGVMQALILAQIVVPHIQDYTLACDGCFARTWPQPPEEGDDPSAPARSHPADTLVELYPDLKSAKTDRERGGQFMTWIVANQVVNAFLVVWIAVGICWISSMMTCLTQTLIAGHLFRKYGSIRRVWWRYAFQYLMFTILLSAAFKVGGDLLAADQTGWFAALYICATGGFVWLGIKWRFTFDVIAAGLTYLVLGVFIRRPDSIAPAEFALAFTPIHLALGFAAAYLFRRRQLRLASASTASTGVSA